MSSARTREVIAERMGIPVRDLYGLAREYLDNKAQASIFVSRIDKMQKGKDLLGDIPETDLTEDEKKILCIVRGWKKRLLELELSICRYELAVGALDARERMVLHLHFEKGYSMSQISQMNLRKYSVEKRSVRTLNRVRQTLAERFCERYAAESPFSMSVIADERRAQ